MLAYVTMISEYRNLLTFCTTNTLQLFVAHFCSLVHVGLSGNMSHKKQVCFPMHMKRWAADLGHSKGGDQVLIIQDVALTG